MYHSRFKGTHYEAGFRYGQLLYNHGKILNSSIIMFMLSPFGLFFNVVCGIEMNS